jgi:lipopolysaccharide biosynthesis protein
MVGHISSLRLRFKALRKKLLSLTPFIRRSRHERAVERVNKYLRIERQANQSLGLLFFSPAQSATCARYGVLAPVKIPSSDELCLFVTHAPQVQLKSHVIDHINALIDAGIEVVLIVNTDLDASAMQIPVELRARLLGCIVRENIGYDFAAWAHAYSFVDAGRVRRLYLVNDSLIGPLDGDAYRKLLGQIRNADADFVGLTCNPDPHEHLQSFYLVFNESVLHSAAFDKFMRSVVCMPSKQNVVDTYEIWLTPGLVRQGFRGVAMFPNLSSEPSPRRDETLYNWRQLLDAGFPFIKAKILSESPDADEARRQLPDRYR